MLSTHLKRRSVGSSSVPMHFPIQGIVDKIYDSLGIKITQQSEVMATIHYDISEDKLLLALKTFLGNKKSTNETTSAHVYKNENGYIKFVSDEGIMAVIPASRSVFAGHAMQISWQEANSNIQSVYEFNDDNSLNLVEWVFTLDKAKAWVKRSVIPRFRKEDSVTYLISISIEGIGGILRTTYDTSYNLPEETAADILAALCKYDTTQMDFVKARAIASQISKFSTINSSFELSIVADSSHNFQCSYKNMCRKSFSVNINGTHYFYADEDTYSVETSTGTEMSCKDGILKCRGLKELQFSQFQSLDSDLHNLREKYFNLFG